MQGVASYTVLTFSDRYNWRQSNAKQRTKRQNKSVDHMMNIFSPRENENLHRSKKGIRKDETIFVTALRIVAIMMHR